MKKTDLLPFKEMSQLEKSFGEPFEIPSLSLAEPRIQMTEKNGQIRIEGKIPGLKKPDISVRTQGRSLVISGEHKEEKNRKEKGGVFQSYSYESVRRVMPIPEGADIRHMNTTIRDGAVRIMIPRKKGLSKAA